MCAGQARMSHAQHPDRRVVILDRFGRRRWEPIWEGLDYIVRPRQVSVRPIEIRNGPGLRPYIAAKTAAQWTWREWPGGRGPPIGEIRFDQDEDDFGSQYAGRIVLEPNIKAKASPNKQWPWVSWNKLAWILQERHGLRVTQLGPMGTPLLDGPVEYVITSGFRRAAAVLKHARAAVLPEGGMHHAAAAVGTPAVVIFGAFIAPAVTGYAQHVNLFKGSGLGCGMRLPCACCAEAMAAIRPEEVAERLMEILMRQKECA